MNAKETLEEKRIKIEQELAALKREEQEQAWLNRKCKTCGELSEEAGGTKGYFTEVQLTVSPGEEGYSHLDTQLCEYCLDDFIDAMQKLNFTIHAHGGICFLEHKDCPGYTGSMDSCPIPEAQFED